MEINQFALYQLKNVPENRDIRFRSYETLQKNQIQIRYGNYEQKYLGRMLPADTPGSIRERFDRQPPRKFHGHSISVSDVLVLNHAGEVTAYYVEKEGFTVIAGFIRNGSSGALVSYDTTDFHIEGKEGSWLAYDSIIIDGKEFFLMEHMEYGRSAAGVVLDEKGKVVVDQVCHEFDETVKKQIREYLNPVPAVPEPEKQKPPMENWQKYYENGEYLRSAEMTEEQNYNMIDGRMNNLPSKPRKIGKRISVLDRLHLKQAEIERRSGKSAPQMAVTEDMERRRK
ncbi:MAG: YodL domain-containing protein [Eubacteriales bacterium]|nr:YodL domain-containing protein [Eubacteriales bacterium]